MELLKKLRVNTDQPLFIIDLPDDCQHLFDSVEIKRKLQGKKPVSQLILFAYDSGAFGKYLPQFADYVGHETLFWICYPKKSGAIASDLIKMEPWQYVFDMGYRGQTSVAINDDWTGMRFTSAPKTKSSISDLPMEERVVEGIDFVNRIVSLPADALAAMSKYKGMAEYFYASSFTFKKEQVMAIVESKKQETRERRIEKLVEVLKKLMHEKPLRRAK
jgi:hypothetical protein